MPQPWGRVFLPRADMLNLGPFLLLDGLVRCATDATPVHIRARFVGFFLLLALVVVEEQEEEEEEEEEPEFDSSGDEIPYVKRSCRR